MKNEIQNGAWEKKNNWFQEKPFQKLVFLSLNNSIIKCGGETAHISKKIRILDAEERAVPPSSHPQQAILSTVSFSL